MRGTVECSTTPVLADPLEQVDRTCVLFRGRKLTYFGGCDYFRLASHPRVLRALEAGLRRHGLNVAASRVTTGNHRLYGSLEDHLARFFGVQSALLVSSGYLTNLVVAQAVAGQFTHALVDARAHACLLDATSLLGCRVLAFKHREATDLARAVSRCGRRARLIVLTDGVFAHDGELAPLNDYLAVLPPDAWILVDDAHGAGVLGRRGRGTAECLGLPADRLIQTVTLSKAFGVYGGVILGSRELRRAILDRSRLFAGNTPLPLPLAAAALEAIRVRQQDRSLSRRLARHTQYVKAALRQAGGHIADTPSPIVSWVPTNVADTRRWRQRLLARRVFPSFIRYARGLDRGYFRMALSSEHTRAQLDALLDALLTADHPGTIWKGKSYEQNDAHAPGHLVMSR